MDRHATRCTTLRLRYFRAVRRALWIVLAALGCSRATPKNEPFDANVAIEANVAETTTAGMDATPDSVASIGCNASGETPSSYSRPALEKAISLREGWSASESKNDDSTATLLKVPTVFPIASKQKNTTVFLRRKIALTTTRTIWFDLGGRAGDTTLYLDGKQVDRAENGAPIFYEAKDLKAGEHVLSMKLVFGKWQGGVRWWGDAAMGEKSATPSARGLLSRTFTSAIDASTQRITLYVPRCVDLARPLPLVVALPGWNGNEWSFAHSRLLDEAERRGFLVLVPNPRGNRLYTGTTEDGVLEAIDLVSKDFSVDPDRVHITGVSMGGAGALQIAYHYPDRFASVVAFYGDSKYDLGTYVSKILVTKETAARYSVLEFPENARNFPVLLVHAKDDDVSGFEQSRWLADADTKLGLPNHRLIAPATGGHTQQLFEDHVDEMVKLFDASKRDKTPARVTFRTSSSHYRRAYWLEVKLRSEGIFGDVDVSFDANARTLHIASVHSNVAELRIDLAALGMTEGSMSLVVDAQIDATLVLAGANASGLPQKLAKGSYSLTLTKI